ncbi:MAG: hypothetical protein ACOCW6_11105 [Spirochaetota bacterium]
MKTNPRAILLLVLLLAVGQLGFAESEWIYAASGSQYLVLNPGDGTIVRRGELRADGFALGNGDTGIASQSETPRIVPTPGGRYVFFVYSKADRAVVVDAESHLPVWTVDLPRGTRSIVFSTMGDTILAHTGGTSWVELPHRQGRITGPGRPAPTFGGGSLAFNRRGTRVYGNRGGDLVYALSSSGEPVQTVSLEGGPYDWHISPTFRFLVGASQAGLAVVDEVRGRVVGYLDGSYAAGVFHPNSREFYALTSAGEAVVVVDVARGRERSRIRPPEALGAIFREDDGTLHGLSKGDTAGAAIVLDLTGRQRRVALPVDFAAPEGTAGGSSPAGVRATVVTLRPGGGFACF